MKKLFRRIGCLFGYHHYSMKDTVFTIIREEKNYAVYQAAHYCVDCGQRYATFITVPCPIKRGES